MADFALGLTKTALEGTLSRVKSAIEDETNLKVTVQHDLVFITGEFQMMQSFLMVATKERTNNQVVKTWVRQLRDLAFDVEDCVEFVVHLDNSSTSWSWMWRLVPSCMAPPRHLDAAVAERNGGDDGHQVISVWDSTGGEIRAASILWKVYNDQKVCQKFKTRAWVKLAHPFNQLEFLQSMLTQCTSLDPTNSGRVRALDIR
ncbi:hypothetical protein HU200_043426 [Digitaria exilis]|uniref:Disease resistance N-terminal domain-containing protein n=1 Tax=Digitaria exilis TaxID=1010633 RepID=A0A835B0N7_9POAL|nr:hypothetical protein HU200_043426 [Digitaria exilis]